LLETDGLHVDRIREDFPILQRKINGRRLVYIDNAATTQKPRQVIDALVDFYSNHNSNVHRSVHTLGEEATAAYEGARGKVAGFIRCRPSEVVFTRGTTESINLVRFAWGPKHLSEGDTMAVTLMEHHSNIVPWQLLAAERRAKLEYVGLQKDGTLDMEGLEKLLAESPKLLAFSHSSNVLGSINDVASICAKARKAGVTTLVDAAQSVPHMSVDVSEIGCDFLAFSGHKMLAPTGIGVLYAKKKLLEDMDPFQGGGEMIHEVFLDHSTWNEVPEKFEAGTVNIADAVGLGAAVDYLSSLGMDAVRSHDVALVKYAMDVFRPQSDVKIYGPSDASQRGGVVSFNVADIHPHDLATILDGEGIAIRSGHRCAQPLMKWLDVAATSRASFYVYNSFDDVDALNEGIKKARSVFKL